MIVFLHDMRIDAEMSIDNEDINKGDTIEHETLGLGVVISVDGPLINVAFKSGVKTLMKNHKSIRKV